MNDGMDFERRLEARLRARASIAVRPFDASAIARRATADAPRPLAGWHLPVRRSTGRPAALLLAAALLVALALAGVVFVGAAVERLTPRPHLSDVPAVQMTTIRAVVDAMNRRDADAFIDLFSAGGHFNPRGDFRESSSVFGNDQPVVQHHLVRAWMGMVDAWGFEAELLDCDVTQDGASSRIGADANVDVAVRCHVVTRWRALSMEITEEWLFALAGAEVLFWDYQLIDLNPEARTLPMGFDDLEAWEAWLAANHTDAAARWLNPREGPRDCDGCPEWVSGLAQGDPERAARLAPLMWHAANDWAIQGNHFAPDGLIPYDPQYAAAIRTSIEDYLRSR